MHESPPVQSTPRLTVCMVVRNDGPAVSQTLQSIAAMADEIVVVDTGSSDGTHAIVGSFSARLIEFPWCDDFSAARNHALAKATGDWVLWLDAGETLSPEDATALKNSVASGQLSDSTAYVMIVKPPVAPTVIAAEQIARIRLMPRRDGLRFQGRVRESIFDTLDNLGMEVDGLPYRILRGPREHEETLKRKRAQRNLRLADLEIADRGRTPQLINCLADAAQTLGDTKRAIDLYSETLKTEESASLERLEAYYGVLTSLDNTPNARSSQLSLCVKALEEFPLDAQLLCAMGGYLQADGRLDLAIRSYQTAYSYGHVNPLVWHLDEITTIAATCLSVALQSTGEEDAALDVLQKAVERDGHLPRLHRALLEIHIKHGRKDAALQQLEYFADEENAEQLALAVEGACLASQRNWASAHDLLQRAYADSCRD